MSARKTILRELNRRYGTGGQSRYARPDTITGYGTQEAKFRAAVNELLKDRLIEGMRGPDGHMVIALNDHRVSQVQKELRPWWASPVVWALGTVLVGLTATGLFL